MKGKMVSFLIVAISIMIAIASQGNLVAAHSTENPIIVCTTYVLGSMVEEFVGDQANVTVLVQPGICPAFYDVKPSDIYAISKAEIIFYHGFEYGMWLSSMIKASGNPNVTTIKISGDWNTPEGVKQYINWIGGNLSIYLGLNLTSQINSMISAVDTACEELENEADSLNVEEVKVVCMKWQKPFVEWLGFNVTAEYGPPEMLSAGQIAALTDKAKKEGVMLVIDNLQSGVDFGASLASEIGAVQVILTNFPGAIPKTENLTQLFRYNAKQLFDGVETWQTTQSLKNEIGGLENQLTIFQTTTAVLIVAAIVEAISLIRMKRKRP